ncbi:MAG: adenine phosphoribosyltransferase [Spirochaetia bacterium]|nr:adenine phosphoribosyltransferase [Spirochaetota bacterium]MCX8097243.1 adenine phosphoribosyltransferase [Spirochaetota bacterium]MDW8111851.1 adenine phosphoribosyltransferase [Spirochaetia bacterium]
MDYKKFIRDVPDFPIQGIIFRDLTTLFKEGKVFKSAINDLYNLVKDIQFDKVVAPEARGFIFGSLIAYLKGCGFVPVRKPSKLPYKTISYSYSLEYGSATLEMHEDAITKGEKVLVVDDLLATGGTTKAMIELVRQLGGEVVATAFLVELTFLKGRESIDVPVYSLITY